MRAFVITGPRQAEVREVERPLAARGEVVVDVGRAGVCGTDVEFFTGEMQYLREGFAEYPMRIGHEWMGTVSALGAGVQSRWLGLRVTGDTMLGCGVCERCRSGRQHVCEFRTELGIRGGRPGALAEQVAVPASALVELPNEVDDAMGAMVEPGGNAWRAVAGAGLKPADKVLILGPGTIGLLCAMFARAAGAQVHLLAASEEALPFVRSIGFENVWTAATLPPQAWAAVIDASNAAELPARALELVEPGKRVVYIGLAGTPSLVDTRLIALKDVTAVGVLSASGGLRQTISAYAGGEVDPRPLIAATVPLQGLAAVLAGERSADHAAGPKYQVAMSMLDNAGRP